MFNQLCIVKISVVYQNEQCIVNNEHIPIRNAGSLSIFKQQLKTHLFQLYLSTFKKKKKHKKKIELSFFSKIFIFLSFPC